MSRKVATVSILLVHVGFAASMAWAQGEATGPYTVDPVHSSVVFRSKHLDLGYVYGRFNEFSGEIQFDADRPERSSFDITIQAASIDTGNEKRNGHLRSPDFFNAGQFPVIQFRSGRVEESGDGKYSVTGDLTLHGQTKPITVEVELVGHGSRGAQFGYRAGFAAEFTIQRSDFGMTYLLDNNMVGDEVKLLIALEGVKQ